jgi:septal ring-binding cell division protein DamX
MVLFGQPELDEKLGQPHIRQLKERITHSFYLDPFPPRDALDYLNFRLRAVGYRGPDIFNEKTAKAVEKCSGGLTRRINIIADKALMAAYSEGVHQVSPKHISTAAIDSDFKKAIDLKPWWLAAAVCASLLLAVWLGTQIADRGNSATVQHDPGVAVVQQTQPQSETVEHNSLLKQRLAYTERWLQLVNDDQYSIQLFLASTSDADAVERFLQALPETLDFEKIYIYETRINGSTMYSVLYNNYASRQTAQTKIENLPADLQASKPYLRRVGALRKDLARMADSASSQLLRVNG